MFNTYPWNEVRIRSRSGQKWTLMSSASANGIVDNTNLIHYSNLFIEPKYCSLI